MSIRIQVLLCTLLWSWRKRAYTREILIIWNISLWTWRCCTGRHHCICPCNPPSSLCLWTFAVLASPCAPVCILHIMIWLLIYYNFLWQGFHTYLTLNSSSRQYCSKSCCLQHHFVWTVNCNTINTSHRQDRLCRIRQTPGTGWAILKFYWKL